MTIALDRVAKTILTKRYGVGIVRFTHHPDCVIFSSASNANDSTFNSLSCTKKQGGWITEFCLLDCICLCSDRIRYHSFFDNKFLRYYTGHTDRYMDLI